jgi:Kef-type K+ transport system membrane component KefB
VIASRSIVAALASADAHAPFAAMALLLVLAAVAGAIAVRLRQPVLIAYIVVGIVIGSWAFGLGEASTSIALLAQIGVAVLLFLVGLKLDLGHVRHIGPVAIATGLGQLGFTILVGFAILLLLGKSVMEAIYVGVALTFSSTIIIVKLLSDKRELDSLHGRIAVGFLIVQDIAVVVAMMVMSALRDMGDTAVGGTEALTLIGSLVGRIAGAGLIMAVLMRWVLPSVVRSMARSQELLLIFAVAWGTGLAALGEWVGFSKEAGAFLAGFSLASTDFREAISARLTGLRDFLLLFFFIHLGTTLDFSTLGGELLPAIVLSLFVLIGNPLIVTAIMGYMGYRKRTGFLAGLTVAQISEFSIVFVAMGIELGHIGNDALGLTTMVGLATIALSTYMILGSERLYTFLSPWLTPFERRRPHRELELEQQADASVQPNAIVFGLGRYGRRMFERLHAAGQQVVGVDFDPEVVAKLREQGLAVRFGDSQDPHFLASLPLAGAPWIISTLPDVDSNRGLIHALREQGLGEQVAIVARDEDQGPLLEQAGAALVLYPMRDAVDHAVDHMCAILSTPKAAPS